MYSAYGYPTSRSSASAFSGMSNGWTIAAMILAVIGGIVLYFTFLSKKNEGKFTGFTAWLYDFFTFKKMVIEHILKIIYLILAIFITLWSFNVISIHFGYFLLVLVGGNLILRIGYELTLVVLIVCRNTTEINKKLDKKELGDKKEENQ